MARRTLTINAGNGLALRLSVDVVATPETPTGLAAVDDDNERDVTLTWVAPPTLADSYTIEHQFQDIDGEWETLDNIVVGAVTTTSVECWQDTHRFRITANNGVGSSSASSWVSVAVAGEWTTFEQAVGDRIVYVSNSGNDSNDGLSRSTPKATIGAARALLRNGYADWLLFKRGETFTETGWEVGGYGGRSAAQRQLWSSYGVGARPKIVPETGDVGFKINWSPTYLAVVGFEVESTGDPGATGVQFYSQVGTPLSDVLIEDFYVHGFQNNLLIASDPSEPIANLKVRRSLFVDAYPSAGGHSQGTYIEGQSGLIVEECVFDHNGWEETDRSDATIFNHNIYMATNNDDDIIFRKNIIARASSHGIQLRCGGSITDNLFVQNPLNIQLGGGDPSALTHTDGVTGTVQDNVIVEALDINGFNPRGAGILVLNIGSAGALVDGNIISTSICDNDVNAQSIVLDGNTYGAGVGVNNVDVTDNIAWAWQGPATFNDAAGSPPSPSSFCTFTGNTFSGNVIQSDAAAINATFAIASGDMAFSNNQYSSPLADDQRLVYNASAVSKASWDSSTGDTGSSFGVPAYVDPDRSLADYNASLGGTSTTVAFLTNARAQHRRSWNIEYTAVAANAYIRAGFAV